MFWVSMGKGGGGGAVNTGDDRRGTDGNLIWVYITLNNNKS